MLGAVCDVRIPIRDVGNSNEGGNLMVAMVIWIVAIGISLGMMLMTAAADMNAMHLMLATLITSCIAACGVRDVFKSEEDNGCATGRAAILTRYIGVMWAWSAVAILITYDLVLQWDGWYAAFLFLSIGSAGSLFISSILRREAKTSEGDVRLVGLVNVMARAQFVIACLVLGMLFAGGNFADQLGSASAWASINICISTAMGFAVLNGCAIATCPAAGNSPISPAQTA
jgi:hypothetical protein